MAAVLCGQWVMSILFWGGWAPLQAQTLFPFPQLEVPWEQQAAMNLVCVSSSAPGGVVFWSDAVDVEDLISKPKVFQGSGGASG